MSDNVNIYFEIELLSEVEKSYSSIVEVYNVTTGIVMINHCEIIAEDFGDALNLVSSQFRNNGVFWYNFCEN